MASTAEFLKTISSIIKTNFSGDPLYLHSFLASIELAECIATGNQVQILIKFIKTRLDGKALEVLPENIDTVKDITDALKAKIKYDKSEIIEGRMMALRIDNTTMQEFAKRAEELAESLRRSYISEGISKTKSMQMATNKAVEMCRLSAKTDLVKSVLASTNFTEPSDVIAKYIIETAQEKKERQVLNVSTQDRNGGQHNSNSGNYQNHDYQHDQNYDQNEDEEICEEEQQYEEDDYECEENEHEGEQEYGDDYYQNEEEYEDENQVETYPACLYCKKHNHVSNQCYFRRRSENRN